MDSITADPNSDAVFTKAATAHAHNTNLGALIHVSVGGYDYTVTVYPNYRAMITYRGAWGHLENCHIAATPAQDAALRRNLKKG